VKETNLRRQGLSLADVEPAPQICEKRKPSEEIRIKGGC